MLNCRLIESFLKIRTTEITWLTRSLVLFKRVSNISYFYSCILCASIYVPFKFVINEQTSVQFIIEYFYYHSIIQYRGEMKVQYLRMMWMEKNSLRNKHVHNDRSSMDTQHEVYGSTKFGMETNISISSKIRANNTHV